MRHPATLKTMPIPANYYHLHNRAGCVYQNNPENETLLHIFIQTISFCDMSHTSAFQCFAILFLNYSQWEFTVLLQCIYSLNKSIREEA